MLNLPSQHPEMYESFMSGNFSVQFSENNSFGRNDAEKTIKNTINKEMKTPSGYVHHDLLPGGIKRDERDVSHIIESIECSFINSFGEGNEQTSS